MKKKITTYCQTLLSTIKIIKYTRLNYMFKYRENIEQTECVIIGNGPSLKNTLETNYNFIAKRDCICVNNMVNYDQFTSLKPKHYLLLDPVFYEEKLSPQFQDIQEKVIKSLIEKTSWPMHIYLPNCAIKNKGISRLPDLNKNINLTYFNATPIVGVKAFMHLCYKHNIGMPPAQNVLVAALFLTLNLGYRKIYLVGADHSWHEELVMRNNIVCLKDKHCYDTKASVKPWIKDIISEETWEMHEILFALGKMFMGYHVIRDYADCLDAKVYNASYKSYIDAFERVEL